MRSSEPIRRLYLVVILAATAAAIGLARAAGPTSQPAALGRAASQLPGSSAVAMAPENQALSDRIGLWDVTETVWPSPGAAPVTTTGLVAERRMVGSALYEVMRPADDAAARRVERTDYLRFNDLSHQWEYLSIDARADIGLMPAKSFSRAEPDGRIVLVHDPFVIPGSGPNAHPVLLRMNSVVSRLGPDRDTKEQHFVAPDGTVWLAHRYSYVRRP